MARVLVVEDDSSMNEILVSTLTDDEHEVVSVFTGQEAIDWCKSLNFDLVLTDVRLPGIDGVETLEQIKRLQPKVRCIVITGYASEDTPVRAIRLNVDDYLFKPFSLKYFLNSVNRVLGQEEERKSKRALFSKLFARFGLSMGNDEDSKLETMVKERQEAFRGLFVGTRSGYLNRVAAASIYARLESMENKFRKLMNSPEVDTALIVDVRESYTEVHERLALFELGADDVDAAGGPTISMEEFNPLYTAIKESEITFDDLLYAPLLRKTPDVRFETLNELLELKRKLWPGTS